MKKIFRLIFTVSFLYTSSFAQNNVGINTASPDASAALDVSSTNQGFLVPRMNRAQRDNINMTNGLSSPATGLLIYQTDQTPGFYFYNGTTWANLNGSNGANGQGVPPGGTAGQVLSKVDAADYNTQWTAPSGGTALPSQAGNAGKSLTTDGTNPAWSAISVPTLQLFAKSTNAQTRPLYAYGRYTFNFDAIAVQSSVGSWNNGNAYTVPAGAGGLFQINTGLVLSAYNTASPPVIAPEIEVTSGGAAVVYYGVGSSSALFQGAQTDNVAGAGTGALGAPYSYSRGNANIILPLKAGDVVKIYYRFASQSTSASQTVSFSTDGSSYLSIVKLN